MARFTQEVKQSSDPDYTRSSRGVDPAPTSKTYDVLFKGLENIATGVVTGIDEGIKDKAYKAVDSEYNQLWDDHGVKVALDSADPLNLDRSNSAGTPVDNSARSDPNQPGNPDGGPGLKPPAGIAEVGKDFERLRAAKEDGRLGNTYYLTRAEAMARQLRSRFPGYEEHVDNLIKSKLGITPANELRKSILNDMENAERARKGELDEATKLIERFPGDVQPDAAKRLAEGRPYTRNELLAHITERKRFAADLEYERLGLAAKKDRNEQVADRALVVATSQGHKIVNATLKQTFSLIDGDPALDFQGHLNKALASNKPLDPEMQTALSSKLTQYRMQVETSVREALFKGEHESLAAMVKDQTKIDKIVENALAPIVMLEKAMQTGDLALFSMAQRQIKAIQNNNMLRAMQVPVLRNIQTLKDAGGDVAVNEALKGSGPVLTEFTTGVRDFFINSMAANGDPIDKLFDLVKPYARESDEFAKLYKDGTLRRNLMEVAVKIIQDPKAPQAIAANVAKSLFGPESGKMLNQYKNKTDLFNILTTPSTTARLKAMGGVEYENYKVWVGNTLRDSAKQSFDNLAERIDQLPYYTFLRDEKTGHITFERNKAKMPKLDPNSEQYFLKAEGTLRTLIQPVNTAITNAVNAYDGNVKEVLKFLESAGLGLPPSGEPKKKGTDGKQSELREDGLIPFALASLQSNRLPAMMMSYAAPGGDEGFDPVISSRLRQTRATNERIRNHVNTQGFTPEMKKFSMDVMQRYPGLEMVSGYRNIRYNASVGGARGSRHIHGDATDFSLKGLSEKEKSALVQELTSNPMVGGLGYYPKSDSLHVDFRNGRVAWGQNRRASSLGNTPSWFRDPVMAWQGNAPKRTRLAKGGQSS
jgi:hypothetical protein